MASKRDYVICSGDSPEHLSGLVKGILDNPDYAPVELIGGLVVWPGLKPRFFQAATIQIPNT